MYSGWNSHSAVLPSHEVGTVSESEGLSDSRGIIEYLSSSYTDHPLGF